MDEADKILDYGYYLAAGDRRFKNNENKFVFLEKCYYLYKLKVLFYRRCYQEFLDLYNEQYGLVSSYISVDDSIIVYCKKKVGIVGDDRCREDIRSYLYRQIMEYREEDFREHIK